MGGTSLRVHECGGMWMTDLSMMQPLGVASSPMACHRSGCERGCCRHPVLSVKVHQDQLPSAGFSLRLPAASRSLFLNAGTHGLFARQAALLALSVHGPPDVRAPHATRQAWLGVYLI